MSHRSLKPVVAVCLYVLVCLLPARASAQATGAITGMAIDSSGAVLPGVTIDVTSRDTGQVRSAVTGGDGFYMIPLVNPGIYQVKGTLAGFRTTIRENVTVAVNETVRADVRCSTARSKNR